ncbi:Pet127-domain-containing protein [Marasmius fiardii PR-910]|nr:Pet127-domain-containing protein [Marasmius fiardii PR-910]
MAQDTHTRPRYSRRLEGFLDSGSRGPVLEDLEPPTKQNPIATLAHGLDRVLFNPGVYWIRDPRSRVYNFDPAIEVIPKVVDFAFERLTGFIRSSRDEDLWALAKQERRKFGGSTSSLSGILSHIYFLLSNNKNVDIRTLSIPFERENTSYSPAQRMATSVLFNHDDGIYAIDSDPSKQEEAEKNILTWMGTLLEKYLTMASDEFLTYMRTHAEKPMIEDDKASDGPLREAYRYSKSNTFVMRSQLDCHDPRLPGTGVFDIKTRASLPIRMDVLNFEESSGYVVDKQHGLYRSFEREYYDLIRSAFLKYSFQARIGNMDGVFVAYHNTERMFGFQYVPLEEMDKRLFGQQKGIGERVFRKCIEMMEILAEEIVGCFPGQSVKCTFETQDQSNEMHIWVEPAKNNSDETAIKELVVTTTSFMGENMIDGKQAIHEATGPWSIHWAVTHLAEPEESIRSRLEGAKARQFRAYSLPSGIDHSQIEEWWAKLNFGGKEDPGSGVSSGEPNFFSTHFQEPDHRIVSLRNLAKRGRSLTQLMEESERGKPRIVYGVGEVYLRDDHVLKGLQEERNEGEKVLKDSQEEQDGEGKPLQKLQDEKIESDASEQVSSEGEESVLNCSEGKKKREGAFLEESEKDWIREKPEGKQNTEDPVLKDSQEQNREESEGKQTTHGQAFPTEKDS